MMKDYLASSPMIVERLLSGVVVTDQAIHDSLILKAQQLDELVRQSMGGTSGE